MTKHTADKTFYDRDYQESDSTWDNWGKSEQLARYLSISERLVANGLKGSGNVSVELGAGTCAMSLHLSRLPALKRMVCMDISASKMSSLAPRTAKAMPGCAPEKLEYLGGSFNEPLPFADGSIDLMLFDASLHHASSPWDLLAECRRVLKDDGLLVAQREQYLGLLSSSFVLRRLLKSDEVTSGVIENAYLRSQYEYFLRARDFEPQFIGVAESTLQKLLSFANGLIYSKWIIAARPA